MKQLILMIICISISFSSGCTSALENNLNQRHVFPEFGFSIAYPDGWTTDVDDPVSFIAQVEEDIREVQLSLMRGDVPKSQGIVIVLDHRTKQWLSDALGLPEENPTLNDLFQLNIDEISSMTDPNITEITLFGVPTIRSEYYDEENYSISYAGYIKEEAFLLSLSAPTKEMLEEFKPTWEAMLDSIEVVEE